MNDKMKFKQMVGYGVGAIGLDLSYGLFYSYLSKYLQSVLGINSLFLLILAPLARIWDGINDPMMGNLVDRTKTKFGKYRPWIVIGAVLNAIVLCFLFNNPGFDTNSTSFYIYIAVFYVLWGMTNTIADIPYWSMIPSFTSDVSSRNMLSTVARTFSGLGQGIIMIVTPYALAYLGDGTNNDLNAQGFSRWTFFAAILLVFFAVLCFLCTKEKRISVSNTPFSFKSAINTIKSNDQLLVFMLFAMISNSGYYMTSGISSYYFADVCGDIKQLSTFNLFGAVGSVLGLAVIPIMSKAFKFTNRGIYTFTLSMAATGYILMMLTGFVLKGNIILMSVAYLIASIGISCMFVSQTVMLADVVDYGEYSTGNRSESLTFSMKGFLQKMAYTVQCILMYATFLVSGYKEGSNVVQTALAKNSVSLLMFIVPPVMIIISLIIFRKKYKIYGEFKENILNEISKR